MLDTLWKDFDHIIVLDLETTGLDAGREEIIELAALRLERQVGSESFDLLTRLSEGRRLPAEITALTGITQSQLEEEGLPKEEVCRQLARLLDCSRPLLVAYNAQFDLCFLYYFLQRFGQAHLLKAVRLLDALTVYRDRRPYPHRLGDAVAAYALPTQNTHRAIDDAQATLELLCAMEEERSDLTRYINLFGYNPKYGVSGSKIASVRYLPQAFGQSIPLYEQ